MTEFNTLAEANDAVRKFLCGNSKMIGGMLLTPNIDHNLVISNGLASLGENTINKVLRSVTVFNDFNEDNDPYGEHDFGKVTVDGNDFFFKIDYYDENFQYGVDPNKEPANLVITVMLASDY